MWLDVQLYGHFFFPLLNLGHILLSRNVRDSIQIHWTTEHNSLTNWVPFRYHDGTLKMFFKPLILTGRLKLTWFVITTDEGPDRRNGTVPASSSSPLKAQIDLNIQPEKEEEVSPKSVAASAPAVKLIDDAPQLRSWLSMAFGLVFKEKLSLIFWQRLVITCMRKVAAGSIGYRAYLLW
jgi:hypothetical protein